MRRIALAAAILALATACSPATEVGSENASSADGLPPSQQAPAAGSAGQADGSQVQPGQFTAGTATITSPSGQATLDFSEGLYVTANDTVVANFADGDSTDPNTNSLGVNGSAAGMNATLIGPLQPQGVNTECTVSAITIEPSGLEGTFECAGGVGGTFEAH